MPERRWAYGVWRWALGVAGRAFPAALAAVVLASTAAPTTAQECQAVAPRITAESHDGRVDLFVEVSGHASIVVVLDAELVNMRADRRLPHVAAYRPGRPARAMTLRVGRVPAQRWSYNYTYHWAVGDHTAVHDDAYRYRIPHDGGVAFRLIQGPDGDFSHGGKHAWDWAMPEGTPVLAARDGLVAETCQIYREGRPDPALRDRGNYIHIQHDDGTLGRYVHFMPNGVRVRPGERVARGQLIGLSGNTGFSAGPHLHFEVVRRRADLQLETLPVRFDRDP